MKAKFSPSVQQKLLELNKKDRKLTVKIEKQIKLFESNPKYPSLRTHKLTGNLANKWSISVSKSLRMVYVILEEDTAFSKKSFAYSKKSFAYFVDLGTHDEVYR